MSGKIRSVLRRGESRSDFSIEVLGERGVEGKRSQGSPFRRPPQAARLRRVLEFAFLPRKITTKTSMEACRRAWRRARVGLTAKRSRRSRALYAIALFLFGPAASQAECKLPEIWVAPLDAEANGRHYGLTDFNAIFDENWARDPARRAINVFKFYPSYLQGTPDGRLTAVLQALKSQNVRVALEASMLTPQDMCAGHFAGDAGEATAHILERVKRLGGRVDYLAMNEPLLHGFRARDLMCSGSVAEAVARNVAATASAAAKVFPDIKIGDIEAIGGDARMKPFLDLFPAWIDAYRQYAGRQLAFFDIDVDTARGPWKEAATSIAGMARKKNVPFGLIYNGVDRDASGEAWVAHGRDHFEEFESDGATPDIAVFQSWAEFPHKFYPASDASSFENFLGSYLEWKNAHCGKK